MRATQKLVITITVAVSASGATALSMRGSAQTMYPHIYGISNLGETCSGFCYAGENSGQYLCCGVSKPPK
jgi:hypothetical protein